MARWVEFGITFFLILLFFLAPRAYASGLPFVLVESVSPDPIEVHDVAAFTVHVESGGAVPVKSLNWAILRTADMAVEWNASASLNETGGLDYVVYHPFEHTGDYFIQAKILDVTNRTAEDIYQFSVDKQETVLTFNVEPSHVNASAGEAFMLNVVLQNDRSSPIARGELSFYYANANATVPQWFGIAVGYTDTRGRIGLVFTPPFEGQYSFRVTYAGDALHTSTDAGYGPVIAAPEFPFTGIVFISAMLLMVAARKIFPS